MTKRKDEIDRLQVELGKAEASAKDEEEKRSKAIALLKTVRQKLVKAEKDRDDAMREVGALKETERVEREKEKVERTKLQAEIDKVNTEREAAVQGLRAQFDKEVAVLREKYDKELTAMRGQYELEAITAKVGNDQLGGELLLMLYRLPTLKRSRTRSRVYRISRTKATLYRGRRMNSSTNYNYARRKWNRCGRH